MATAGAFTFAEMRILSIGTLFLVSAICSLLFNLWVMLCYESYIACKYTMTGSMQSNYGAGKYGLTLALGTSSIVLFILGLILAFVTISGH